MRAGKWFVACVLGALLSACGGGGDDAGTGSESVGSASPVGIWQGSTSTGRTAYFAVLSSGEYWAIYTTVGGTVLAGAVQGHWTSSGTNFSSSDALDFITETGQVFAATVSGTFSPTQSITSAVTYANGQRVTSIGTPVSGLSKSVSGVAGTYIGAVVVNSIPDNVAFGVNAAGGIAGNSISGCSFTGTLTPRNDVVAFDVTVTFQGAPCALGTQTVTGIAIYNPATRQLVSAALNAARTGGYLFAGTRE